MTIRLPHEISTYLEDFNKNTCRGDCKLCKKTIQWSRLSLVQHKRSSCTVLSDEEKLLFAKRKSYEMNKSTEDLSQLRTGSNAAPNLTQQQKEDIDEKFANFFYRTGISFRVADSASLKELVKALNTEYAETMPSAKVLSRSLLDKTFSKASERIEQIVAQSGNLTLISDGWTNVRGDHIVNFCIKAPGKKSVFQSSINTSDIAQNAEAVASAICSVIDGLGAHLFCAVITDNPNVMKSAWDIIEATYTHISAYGCAAHVMNLLVKDIMEIENNTALAKDSEKIIKFVTNHHTVKARFETMRKTMKVVHTLTMPVVTRWISRYPSLRDLMAAKFALRLLVDEEEDLIKEISPKPLSLEVMNLVRSTGFWDKLGKLIKIIELPTNVIGELKLQSFAHIFLTHFCFCF